MQMVGFRSSSPPTPPSRIAATEKMQFTQGLIGSFKEPQFWVLMLGFGIGTGVFYDLCTLINQFVEPYHYSQTDAGILGSVILFVGLLGALVIGPVSDKTKAYPA